MMTSRLILALLPLILIAPTAGALLARVALAESQERIVLTTPVYQEAGVTDFRVESLYLKRAHPDGAAEIRAILREVDGTAFVTNGKALVCRYDDDEADALIVALNKMNLSTISLERRIIARCQQDGKLGAGAVSGTPQ